MRLPFRSRPARRSPEPRPVPTTRELATLDVEGFVDRLDRNLEAIAHHSSLAALLPPEATAALADSDPRFAGIDALFRASLRGTLVATSFRDLPEPARAHPEVQSRLWSAMDDMDVAVQGVGGALQSLTSAEQAEISRALRDEPDLGAQVLAALDAEAAKAGVSEERRAHLQKMGQHACFRLRQSTPAFIDEYAGKVARARPRDVADAERYLLAQMGEPEFHEERDWQFAVQREWQSLLAAQNLQLSAPEDPSGISADDAYAPPAGLTPPPVPPGDPNSGKTVLKVGAWLFGIGVMCGLTGALLVNARNDNVVLAGLISFTAAAVLSLGGILCLLVGAILRLRARSRARYQLEES